MKNGESYEGFVTLHPELFRRLEADQWPLRDRFVAFFKKKTYKGDSWRGYSTMRAGGPFPQIVGVCLVEYLREIWEWTDVTVENALQPALAPEHGPWQRGWSSIMDVLTENLKDLGAMYVHNPRKEIPMLAEKFVKQVGRAHTRLGEALDEDACLRRGEAVMNRSHKAFARYLMEVHRKEFRSIMYAVIPRHHKNAEERYQRVSASVLFPISASAFQRFCAGEITDMDMTANDIENPSKYLFAEAVIWLTAPGEVPDKVKENAEVRCVMYQSSYFTRFQRLKARPWRPAVCTVGGIPLFRQRLMRLGFRETGKVVPGTVQPIMVLQHRRECSGRYSFKRYLQYKMMQLSLRLYQMANYWHWKKEDQDE